jgi:hypothetical protein
MTLTRNHFLLFNAVSLWQHTLNQGCSSLDKDYSSFMANANATANENMESEINQIIADFYDYFYMKGHICDVNFSNYGNFGNLYGTGEHTMDIALMLQSLYLKNEFRNISFYVFDLFITLRDELNLPRLEKEKDEHLVKYYSRL